MISTILFFVFWCIMVGVVYTQARDQGRNIFIWVGSTFLVSPVIPAVILFALPRVQKWMK